MPAHELVRSTDGAPLCQRTVVRVAWLDQPDASLLVRFECADVDAWSTFTERDAPLWSEEAVEVLLAPGGDTPRRYVEIEVSPRGVLFDASIDNPDGLRATLRADAGWSCLGIVWAAGRLPGRPGAHEDWWAEIVLPLRSVAPEAPTWPGRWRANFLRIERPRSGGLAEEYAAWSPTWRDPPDFHVPERFGVLCLPPKVSG